jgi:hypothetical protein
MLFLSRNTRVFSCYVASSELVDSCHSDNSIIAIMRNSWLGRSHREQHGQHWGGLNTPFAAAHAWEAIQRDLEEEAAEDFGLSGVVPARLHPRARRLRFHLRSAPRVLCALTPTRCHAASCSRLFLHVARRNHEQIPCARAHEPGGSQTKPLPVPPLPQPEPWPTRTPRGIGVTLQPLIQYPGTPLTVTWHTHRLLTYLRSRQNM